VVSICDRQCIYIENGVRQTVKYCCQNEQLYLDSDYGNASFSNATHAPAQAAGSDGDGQIRASMDGAIVEVLAHEGQQVNQGDTLIVLEAMKMEHQLKADKDGILGPIGCSAGDQVKARQLLATISDNPADQA